MIGCKGVRPSSPLQQHICDKLSLQNGGQLTFKLWILEAADGGQSESSDLNQKSDITQWNELVLQPAAARFIHVRPPPARSGIPQQTVDRQTTTSSQPRTAASSHSEGRPWEKRSREWWMVSWFEGRTTSRRPGIARRPDSQEDHRRHLRRSWFGWAGQSSINGS